MFYRIIDMQNKLLEKNIILWRIIVETCQEILSQRNDVIKIVTVSNR